MSSPSPTQQRDTVLALLLILLIAFYFTRSMFLIHALAVILVAGMIAPQLFSPAARVWFGFSHLLGTVVSRVFLGVIFFALVTPVGLVRRLMGRDPMALCKWKKSSESVFVKRDHSYVPEDLKHPY